VIFEEKYENYKISSIETAKKRIRFENKMVVSFDNLIFTKKLFELLQLLKVEDDKLLKEF
jgi:hypothetical protein